MKESEDDIEFTKALTRNGDQQSGDIHADAEGMEDVWFLTGMSAKKDLDVYGALNKVHQQMDKPKVRSIRDYKWPLGLAAVVSMFVVASIVVYLFMPEPVKNTYQTDSTKSEYTLPDGSEVALNRHTQITFVSDTDERIIQLVGEAFFTVSHNSERPFIVKTNDAVIEVVGTQFNVKAYAGEPTVVTVKEGKVKTTFLNEGKTFLLSAEDQIQKQHQAEGIQQTKVEDSNYLAWNTGLLEFKEATLPDIAARLEELYGIEIEFNEQLATCKLTVKFDNRDLDFILSVLEATLKLEVQKDDRKYVLSGQGC